VYVRCVGARGGAVGDDGDVDGDGCGNGDGDGADGMHAVLHGSWKC